MGLIEELRTRKGYLLSTEVMALLRLSKNTLCAHVRAGKIPAVRNGNTYLYDPHTIADWLEARSTVAAGKRAA